LVVVPEGTPLGVERQSAGDCLIEVCDGHGSSKTEPDDQDHADGGNECTTNSCDEGAPATTFVAQGQACTASPGAVCDGQGRCVACLPGSTQSCYTGPLGTEGTGMCKAGVATCLSSGEAYGPCVGDQTPKTEICSTVLDEDCDGTAEPCAGNHLWSKHYGGALDDDSAAVASDSAGNVYVAGFFGDIVDFGAGPVEGAGGQDAFLLKLDPNGGFIWLRTFGDVEDQGIYRLAVDAADNVIVTGWFSGTLDLGGLVFDASPGQRDLFVAKLSPAGTLAWGRRLGVNNTQYGSRVAVDPAGDVFVAGDFIGNADFGGGSVPSAGASDVFLVKYDAMGGYLWSRRFGDSDAQYVFGIAVDPAGRAIITGPFYGVLDFGDGPLQAKASDVMLARFEPDGATAWSKRFGSPAHEHSFAVGLVGEDIVITGFTEGAIQFGDTLLTSVGSADAFVVRLDTLGVPVWAKRFGDALFQTGTSIAVGADGDLIIGGEAQGSVDYGGGAIASPSGDGAFLLKLEPLQGGHIWSHVYGVSGTSVTYAVATDLQSNVLFAGYFHDGNIDLGGGVFSSIGVKAEDVFLAKLSP
jgi:hypothetical protein